ncbi:hypothetical protein DOTSEDRAFT_27570 [Dothistroma septosporum NZE10]|uniref:Uncharacterized protein n=1 Tax=Dothistroma septosporum (strain NZE10 / CBS 128990) TaxID=675120 RepID=N1PHF0_DOTSN|nr:hypothetical protein DOTSEDRAFT_27570 [Dothistroma septosporum NZE10]
MSTDPNLPSPLKLLHRCSTNFSYRDPIDTSSSQLTRSGPTHADAMAALGIPTSDCALGAQSPPSYLGSCIKGTAAESDARDASVLITPARQADSTYDEPNQKQWPITQHNEARKEEAQREIN